MPIDRCYCYQQSFATLHEVAEQTGADSIEALQAHVTFGENCQLCHPYVRRMLETGETIFHEVIEAEASSPDDADREDGPSP
jgi:bacterioferritin-associated ferredoxin